MQKGFIHSPKNHIFTLTAKKFLVGGFTLLEVIIAIFILSTVLMGSLALINMSVFAANVSANKLIAVNLAQEGIEVARNIRDSSADWAAWHSNPPTGNSIQYNSVALGSSGDTFLKLDSDGYYRYDSGTATLFKRKIILTKISADETKIVSEVTWISKGKTLTLSVEGRLWNWK